MTWRRLVPGATAEVLLALGASAAGVLVYQGFFTTSGYLPALVLACLVGGVTAAVGHRRVWSTALLAVAGPVLIIVFGVFRGDFSLVLSGLHGSWNRLFTVVVPVGPWTELLAVPALVTWASAFTSVLLVLRSRTAPAPLGPPLLAFVFAVFVAGNQAGDHAVAAVVFVAVALPLIAIRAHRDTGDHTVRVERRSPRSIPALAVVVLMVTASAVLGVAGGQKLPLASGEHRFDARELLAPPITNTDTITPLSQVRGLLKENPPRTLFTVRVSAESARQIHEVRTAALDVFDGTTWTSADTYRRVAGSRLTVEPALENGVAVTARIEVNDLPGPYLPIVGRPSRLTSDGNELDQFGFAVNSGVVINPGQNTRGLRYEQSGEYTPSSASMAALVTPTPNPVPDPPAGMPDSLRKLAEQVKAQVETQVNEPSAYRLAQGLETTLRSMPNRLDSLPGHSYGAIDRMLTDETGRVGFVEQQVSAFALVARTWGFQARVAVGYRLHDYQDGAFQVRTGDAHTWSEIHFPRFGWIPFDPARIDGEKPLGPPVDVPRVAPPPSASPTTAQTAAQPTPSPSDGKADAQGSGWGVTLLDTALLLVPASLVLLVLGAGFVVMAKTRRRARRLRHPDPATRVLGAWRDQLDLLLERGVSPPVSLTFHEVAEHTRTVLGPAANLIEASAELATTAAYAPEHISESDAREAWRLAGRLRVEVRPPRRVVARLLAAVNPRPLWAVWSADRQRRQMREDLEMGRYR